MQDFSKLAQNEKDRWKILSNTYLGYRSTLDASFDGWQRLGIYCVGIFYRALLGYVTIDNRVKQS
jgi:hypothetical protein